MDLSNACFVGMAIGTQTVDGKEVEAEKLSKLYTNFIKHSIEVVRPNLDIIRADEVADPGTITNDILDRLLNSAYSVFDVTYGNANVFYELGIRHCSGKPTILIRDKAVKTPPPFDIVHQRHIPYENTVDGLSEFKKNLSDRFDWFDQNMGIPNNQVMSFASTSGYDFQQFGYEANLEKMRQSAKLMANMLKLMGAEEIAGYANIPPAMSALLRMLGNKEEAFEPILVSAFEMGLIDPITIKKFLTNSMKERQRQSEDLLTEE